MPMPKILWNLTGRITKYKHIGVLFSPLSINQSNKLKLINYSFRYYELYRLQIITARDVRGGPVNFFHWFMGGLDMQIEHHLFPTVPR